MRTPLLIAAAGVITGAAFIALLPEHTLFSVGTIDPAGETATGERWACPMMDFIGNRPGPCPVCGMAMTRVTAGELTREQQRRMDLQLTRITSGPAQLQIRAYGTVRYDERTVQVVIPRVGGRIVKRHDAARHAGTLVAAGDPIVDLYSPEIFAAQGELAAALSLGDQPTIRALTDRFERWNLGSVAQAILSGNAPTDTVTITSPFAGRVVLNPPGETPSMENTLPREGQEVAADTPLIRLVDPSAFMLVLQVPEARAHWLTVGQPARLATDDRGEIPEVTAAIAWVAPELYAELRTREVHLHLTDPENRLLPGSLVSAHFAAALTPDLHAADPAHPESWGTFPLVPKSAVLSTGVRHVAWKVAERQPDGRLRFELAPLALGPRLEDPFGNDVYVVRAGLAAGDEVATQGAFLIDSQAQLAGTPSLLFPTGSGTALPAGSTDVAPASTHVH